MIIYQKKDRNTKAKNLICLLTNYCFCRAVTPSNIRDKFFNTYVQEFLKILENNKKTRNLYKVGSWIQILSYQLYHELIPDCGVLLIRKCDYGQHIPELEIFTLTFTASEMVRFGQYNNNWHVFISSFSTPYYMNIVRGLKHDFEII